MTEIRDNIAEYYRLQQRILQKQLSKIILKPGKKQIHKLRVAIKNLRAMHQLTEILSDGAIQCKKNNKKLKALFAVSGSIREAQINRKMAKKYLPDASWVAVFDKWLRRGIKINKRELYCVVRNFDILKYEDLCQSQQLFFEQFDFAQFEALTKQFFQFQIDTLRLLHIKMKEEDTLHDVRKILKRIKATLAAIVVHGNNSWEESLIELAKIETQIGMWHDRVVFRDTLKIYLALPETAEEFKGNEPIFALQELEQDIESQQNEISLLLDKILNTATI